MRRYNKQVDIMLYIVYNEISLNMTSMPISNQ